PAGATSTGSLHQLSRQLAQAGANQEEDQRSVLNTQQKDDAARGIERVASAERRGKTDHLQERACRSEKLKPGQRRNLRRDHQGQYVKQDKRTATAHVGEGDRKSVV